MMMNFSYQQYDITYITVEFCLEYKDIYLRNN